MEAIPSPPSLPFLGHAFALGNAPALAIFDLSRQYGEILQLKFPGRSVVVVNSVELVNEVSNERKFIKRIVGALWEARALGGDGIFLANKDEPNWGIAHRLLTPIFRSIPIQDMFPDMYDICSQLVLKWKRFGPDYRIKPEEDFNRLAIDTLLLACMSYRLNSFYKEKPHPFMQAMTEFLLECSMRAKRPGLVGYFMSGTNAKFQSDIEILIEFGNQIISERLRNPTDKNDVLNVMMFQKDSRTGEGLSEEAMRNNLMNFIIAGQETTSALLTFTLYFLLKHPDVMRKAQDEVDEVLGDEHVQLADLRNLTYINAILRETLRIGPTAPFRQVFATEDTTIGGGKYFVQKDQPVLVNIYMSQRDPKVWGPDADEFRPERMLDGKFEALPSNAWQPFGFGSRVCIGRPFAWQEAQIVVATILQKFDFRFADDSETPGLSIRQNSLTIRPEDYTVYATPRTRKATV